MMTSGLKHFIEPVTLFNLELIDNRSDANHLCNILIISESNVGTEERFGKGVIIF
jgi:hypothetical protein